jgi:hypothetical protein
MSPSYVDPFEGRMRHRGLVLCRCRVYCGDVSEEDDPDGVCKGLPGAPEPPPVEIVLVHRNDPRFRDPEISRDMSAR